MIRHSPCEKYIEYLLVHPDEYSDDTILELLRLKQLDFIGPDYLGRLRMNLHPPDPFRPYDTFHRPSQRFITAQGLYYLFHPDKATKQALKVLDMPRAKELIESMLITFDAPALIAHRLLRVCRVTPEAVERYGYFFFDASLVDSVELNALMRLRTDFVAPNSDSYQDQTRAALKSAGHGDARRNLAKHANTDLASVMNGMRMGYMPARLDLARLIGNNQVAATTKTFSVIQTGSGPHAAAEARDWALVGKMMGEMLQEVGSPDADLQRELQSLALRTDSNDVPHIAQLSGGEHTVDLQPLEVKGVVEDE